MVTESGKTYQTLPEFEPATQELYHRAIQASNMHDGQNQTDSQTVSFLSTKRIISKQEHHAATSLM